MTDGRVLVAVVLFLPALGMTAAVLVDIVRRADRSLPRRIAWLVGVLAFPGIGAMAYLLTHHALDAPVVGFGQDRRELHGFFGASLELAERRLAGDLSADRYRAERARLTRPSDWA